MRLRCGTFLSLALLVVVAALVPTALAQPAPSQTPEDRLNVVQAYQQARSAGDVDMALAQFGDNAVINIQGRSTMTFNGRDEMRRYLQGVGVHFKTLMRSEPTVQGSAVMWTERDVFGSQAIDQTVTAIVNSGHIVSITYRTTDTLPTSTQVTTQLPSYTWPVALSLVCAGLLFVAFGLPRRRTSRSQLDGQLLVALRDERTKRAA